MRYEVGVANRLGNRAANQDRLGVVETDEGILLVLADGMGGMSQGELAAQTLVEMARNAYQEAERPVRNPPDLMTDVIHRTHDELVRINGDKRGPGTTAVLCLIQNGEAQWAHVGDSRLYVFRNGQALLRTRDHSYVEELFRRGLIDSTERARHPRRHQITQCIGCGRQRPQVSVARPRLLHDGDVILICSDGLWEAVDEDEMARLLAEHSLEEATYAMAEQAETAAYPHSDNISVIALRVLASAKRRRPIQLARPEPNDKEKVETAIDEIQRMIREYEDEMNR